MTELEQATPLIIVPEYDVRVIASSPPGFNRVIVVMGFIPDQAPLGAAFPMNPDHARQIARDLDVAADKAEAGLMRGSSWPVI